MADYIVRQIDKIGELLLAAAYRIGLFKENPEGFDIQDLREEFKKVELEIDLDKVLESEFPADMLVNQYHLSDRSMEIIAQMLFNSESRNDSKVNLAIKDILSYLRSKGYISIALMGMDVG